MLKSANFSYLLDTTLKKVFDETKREIPSLLSVVYNMQSSDKASEYVYEMGDIGTIGQFNGKVDYQEMYGQYRTTFTNVAYATGVQIDRELIDDDQYGEIVKIPRSLAICQSRLREEKGIDVFNNAFNSGYPIGDALCLCNDAHTAVGVSTTWDNAGSATLNAANVSATRLLMMKYTSTSNKKINIIPDIILVPIDKEEEAKIIVGTDKAVHSANNDINFHQGKFTVLVSKYLSSAYYWYMMSSDEMKMSLNWFDRVMPEFNKDVDTDTYTRKYSTYSRFSNGAVGWRFIYGQAATS
jgi:phage major head subunit gpT-like protein